MTTSQGGVDINDRGQVLIFFSEHRFFWRAAFLYNDGQVHQVGDLTGGTDISSVNPRHLNELGQVVGFSSLAGWTPADPADAIHAFFYSDDDGR